MSESNQQPADGALSSPSFEALIKAAHAGDAAATGKLLNQCRPYLLMIANQEIAPEHAAKEGPSDIVQNTLVSAMRCLDGFEGRNHDDLRAWLRGILLNDLKDARRRYNAARRQVGREQPLDDGERKAPRIDDGCLTPSSAAAAQEEAELLKMAMSRLSSDEQQAIELRNWQRLPFAEIGEQTGRSADAARKLWSRACLRLQKELESIRD